MKKLILTLSLLLLATTCVVTADEIADQAYELAYHEVINVLARHDTATKIRVMKHMADVFDQAANVLRDKAISLSAYREMPAVKDFGSESMKSHNYYRAQGNLNNLSRNNKLYSAAFNKCTYMYQTKDFAHTSIDWTTYANYIDAVWYDWYTVWENIAYWYDTAWDVTKAWYESQPHYENLMNPLFKEIGIAYVWWYACAEFGTQTKDR